MLVLTRKSNESIMIGDEIEISILAISGEKARIGIEAPRTVPVFRKEVYNGHYHGGRDDREREQREAQLALLAAALDAARPGTVDGAPPPVLAAHDRLGRLLAEGFLVLRERLAHPHDRGKATSVMEPFCGLQAVAGSRASSA